MTALIIKVDLPRLRILWEPIKSTQIVFRGILSAYLG